MGARQFIQHPLPNTLLVPTAEMIVYGLPGWKILGQHPPLTAAFGEVENRIHNLSPVVFGRSATPASHLEIVGNAAPLLFAQIRQVGQFKSHAMLRVLDSLAVLFSRQLLIFKTASKHAYGDVRQNVKRLAAILCGQPFAILVGVDSGHDLACQLHQCGGNLCAHNFRCKGKRRATGIQAHHRHARNWRGQGYADSHHITFELAK